MNNVIHNPSFLRSPPLQLVAVPEECASSVASCSPVWITCDVTSNQYISG